MRTHKLTFVIALVALAAGLHPASLLGQAPRHRGSTHNIASSLSWAQWPGQGSARGRGRGLGPKCDIDAQIGQTLFHDNGGETTLMVDAALPFCDWQITGVPPWITLTQSSGFGDASVGVLVEPLPNVSRYADLLVADTRIRIYQQPPLTLAANCSPTARRGVHNGLICFVVVRPWPNTGPTADLTVFGGSDRSYIPYSLADGVFDLVLTIPGDFPLGPVEIPFRVEDMWGNVATAIGRFEVIPWPSLIIAGNCACDRYGIARFSSGCGQGVEIVSQTEARPLLTLVLRDRIAFQPMQNGWQLTIPIAFDRLVVVPD